MSTAESFWAQEHRWPSDPLGNTFLFRAVHRVGRSAFGECWTGQEPLLKPVTASSAAPAPPRSILAPPTRPARNPDAAGLAAALLDLSPEHQLADATSRIKHMERYDWVCRWIVSAAANGLLEFGCRPVAGGAIYVVPVDHWNTESWSPRFIFGQYNPKEPFGVGAAGSNYYYLFCLTHKLDELLGPAPVAPSAQSQKDVHLSPYLKLMIAVVDELGITPDNQPKIAVVEEALSRRWRGAAPLSLRLVKGMATAIREPESQRGRARAKLRVTPI